MAFGALCAHTGMTSSGWELGTTLICDVTLGILASHTQRLHQSRHHHCVPWHHHRPRSVTWKWSSCYDTRWWRLWLWCRYWCWRWYYNIDNWIILGASWQILIIKLLTSSPWSSSPSSWPSSPSLTSSWFSTLVRALILGRHLGISHLRTASWQMPCWTIYGLVRQ